MKQFLAVIICWALLTVGALAQLSADALTLGFSNDAGFDNTPAWNNLVSSGDNSVYFNGQFTFKTAPNGINRVMHIVGNGVNGTTFYRDYEPVTLFEPFIKSTKALHMQGIGVIAKQGQGGVAVELSGLTASASTLRDLYISAQVGANWAIPLKVWSDDPLGIRGVFLENIELFAATLHGFWFVNVQGLTAGVQYYPAGGTVSHAVIQHFGSYRSASIDLVTRHLVSLYIYGTDNAVIKSINGTNIITSSDSTNVRSAK